MILLVLGVASLTVTGNDKTGVLDDEQEVPDARFVRSDYTLRDPMYIDSNDDFAAYGWTGDGSVANPYLLEGAEFSTYNTSSGHCIDIIGTTASFVIRDCYFHTNYLGSAGVYLDTVRNGTIVDSRFNATALAVSLFSSSSILLQGLQCDSTVIFIDTSDRITVDSCDVQWGPGDGVSAYQSYQVTIRDCTIRHSAANGIYLYFSDKTTIVNNVVRDNSDLSLFIDESSSLNTIYANIFDEDSSPVKDDGVTNSWDDGVSRGNWYSDYDGSGTYTIPGSANSADHYPDGPLTSITTTTSDSTTTTTNSTYNGTVPITDRPVVVVNVSTYTPLDPLTRGVYAIWVGALLGGAAILLAVVSVKKGGLLKFLRKKNY